MVNKNTHPEVSVIIPAYNSSQTIKHSIESVLGQTYTDYELIIIDDASTDDLNSVLQSFQDANITLIRHTKNQGAAAARNTGIQAARGFYLAFLDSDDIWHSDKLEKQIAFMKKNNNPKIKASCTSFSIHRFSGRSGERILYADDNWQDNLLNGCTVSPGSTLVAEKSLYTPANTGLHDTSLKRLEDWDWLLTYIKSHQLGIVEDILSDIRLSGYPRYETVRESANILKQKRLQDITAAFGKKKAKLFLAGLEVEKATAAFRTKKYAQALAHTIKILFISPERLWRLTKRIAEKIKSGDHSGRFHFKKAE
jgi:glycosyltransferase involved in cell wall biosynthesis